MRMSRWLLTLAWGLLAPLGAWASEPVGGPLYLYRSPTTEQHFAAQQQSYEQITRRWRTYLAKYGENAKILTLAQLLAGPRPGVLILPTLVALDGPERAAIARFAEQGGSLLGNGLIGSRDEQGKFVGFDFLHRTFQVRSHGFFPESEDTFFMPFGDGPLTWPIPAARRMPLGNTQDSLLRISADHESAVVMNWSRTMPTAPHAVMAFNEVGHSRLAYFSAPDNAWPRSKDAALLLDATLAWLRREPQVYKAAWPHGFVASHLIEMDTEDQFHSAPNFAKHLESEGFKGTFYSLTTEAIREPKIVRDLIQRGHEIAYHADVHFGFKGDAQGEQELRIRFMKQQMQRILGERAKEATGFRAPTESYDITTERLLRKHGILHHAADESSSEDRLPFFSVAEAGVPPDQALVVLPRTQMDDVDFTALKYTPEQVNTVLQHDLALTVRSGGFGLLSVHSQNYVEGGLMLRAMGEYIRKVATYRDRLWVARGDEIARWWRQREAVTVTQQWRSKGVDVVVKNANAGALAGLTVLVTLPGKNAAVQVATSPRGVPVRIKTIDAFRVALVFEQLAPGSTELRVSFP